MKKLKVTLAFTALVLIMNSCVYSLFPIYTKDTLVYLPELVGKWQAEGMDDDSYIEFIPINYEKKEGTVYADPNSDFKLEMNDDSDGDPDTYNYIIQGDNWSIKSDDPITVERNGQTISDPALVKSHYDSVFGGMEMQAKEGLTRQITKLDSAANAQGSGFGKALNDLGKGLSQLGEALKESTAKFKGTAYVSTEESYKMVVMTDGERLSYQAHVVEIGEDYFLDLYPLPEYSDNTFSNNLFPVHTFMKMNIEDGQLKLTQFDLEKLNELFESNLVRLRHEYVDGNVVITAQPEEIQKFLDRYSNDETVFEGEETYTKTVL